ncbi:MAG: glycosyltransferase family 2 protein [Parvularculaceae bacterium]
MPHKPPRAAVIIVNWNAGARRIERCLAALAAQNFRDFEVLLVDNGSSDNSLDALTSAPFPVRLLKQSENLGFARANNLAARATAAPLLALLNPDAYPEPGWLGALIRAADKWPDAAAFGSLQIDANDPGRLDGAGDAYHVSGLAYRGHFGWPAAAAPRCEAETFAPCAAAALYRRDPFLALGGFDERFFCYHEDVDLGFRLRLAGWSCLQIPQARVAHEGSALTGRRSEFAVYHGTRNRIWTFVKNMPGALIWALAPLHAAANLAALARSAMTGSFGPTARGVRDALKEARAVLAERRRIQAARRAGVSDLARQMAWSPVKLLRREAVLRPVKDGYDAAQGEK